MFVLEKNTVISDFFYLNVGFTYLHAIHLSGKIMIVTPKKA